METMKELKDLVPPRELCEQAAEVVGNGTALVWINWAESFPVNGPYQWSEKWHVAVLSECNQTYPHRAAPAPTLAELLEIMMADEYLIKHPQVHHDGPDWTARAFVPGALVHEHDPANPATAALRLLMRVKGATK